MKKFITIMLSLLILLSVFSVMTGCGGQGRKPDTGKTQFYIGNYDGGVGRKWIEKLAAKFEEDFAETRFEEGKKGVQIWFSHLKDEYKPGNLIVTMDNYREDIYFLDSIIYEDFVSQNKLLDITDVLRKPNPYDTQVNGNYPSIESKTDPSRLALYRYNDGKYYAMPFFDHVLGIVYDVDLFESERLYNNGNGPDGKPNTFDDGLPATYEEFLTLMDTMKQKGITPFTWCGRDGGYRSDLLTEVWLKYDGYENFQLNNTFNGEYTFPKDTLTSEEVTQWQAKVNADGTQTVRITPENGYLLQRQEGKLVALEFAKDILSDRANYSEAAFYTSQMHTDAQEEYLVSIRRPRGTNQIAMLVEGSWWENEARPVFDEMKEAYNTDKKKYGYGERRFGFMPLPSFEGGVNDNTVYMGKGVSAIVASAKTKHPELCKTFLQYIHTNESLAFFNAETGITRPYEYTMTKDQFNSMTYFGQSLRQLVDSDAIKVYSQTADSSVRMKDSVFFNDWMWGAIINGNPYNDAFLAFRDSANSWMTAKTYFDGLSAMYDKTKWARQYDEWINKGYIQNEIS